MLAGPQRDAEAPPRDGSAGLRHGAPVTGGGPAGLVLLARRSQERPPRRHLWPAAEQRPALAFGHAPPHSELNAIVKGVCEALGANRAPLADELCSVLRGSLNKQLIRVTAPTRRPARPIVSPNHGAPPLGFTPATRIMSPVARFGTDSTSADYPGDIGEGDIAPSTERRMDEPRSRTYCPSIGRPRWIRDLAAAQCRGAETVVKRSLNVGRALPYVSSAAGSAAGSQNVRPHRATGGALTPKEQDPRAIAEGGDDCNGTDDNECLCQHGRSSPELPT
jgi:hypothetical protein